MHLQPITKPSNHQWAHHTLRPHLKNYAILSAVCVGITILAFIIRPHDCGGSYGPAPYYYNTDVTIWLSLAEHPMSNLKDHPHLDRPLFSYLGWVFAQPVRLIIGDKPLVTPIRAGGTISINLAYAAGLFLANSFLYLLFVLATYHLTAELSRNLKTSLLAGVLAATCAFSFVWAYQPVYMMGGAVVILTFPLFLLLVDPKPTFWRNCALALGCGILLLLKPFVIIPFIYLIWALIRRYRVPTVLISTALFFVPTLLWRVLYTLITNSAVPNFDKSTATLANNLLGQLFTAEGLSRLINQALSNLADFPAVLFTPNGLIVTIFAIGFFLTPRYYKRYSHYYILACIYFPAFFALLTLSGFFSARHGGDFAPFIFPAAAIFFMDYFREGSNPKWVKYLVVGLWLLTTIFSYTYPWMCSGEFL